MKDDLIIDKSENHEVIQRYCPMKGENVVMIRSVGVDKKPKCICYDSCPIQKKGKCWNTKNN